MTAALEVENLSYEYPDGHVALTNVTLRVESGDRVALLGPNGAGKTTLALHLNGIKRASAGTISVMGIRLRDDTLPEIRRRVGLVFQDPNDQLFMPRVADDVAFGPANLGLRGDELRRRVAAALEAVGGSDLAERVPHHLSGGEKRRAAIATVLAMQPDVLVLDEPASGLDPAGQRELADVLADLPITQLVVTHDLPLALRLCPTAAVMDRGSVVEFGATADILADSDLLARHRLELPYGFDPSAIAPAAPDEIG